jgi:hypothetical protein
VGEHCALALRTRSARGSENGQGRRGPAAGGDGIGRAARDPAARRQRRSPGAGDRGLLDPIRDRGRSAEPR